MPSVAVFPVPFRDSYGLRRGRFGPLPSSPPKVRSPLRPVTSENINSVPRLLDRNLGTDMLCSSSVLRWC